ncbi:MAG: hypothetical protein H6985_03075 [Pseudomonadales bacterium]|nr:hypothetical protein [Pseudomonadales bacterium]
MNTKDVQQGTFKKMMNENITAEQEPTLVKEQITKELSILDKVRALSINDKVEEMRKEAKETTFVAGRMAVAGQINVFYAGPNTGKTLLTLKLISEAIATGSAGDHVYHINLDDTFDGLIQKAELGKRHGFHEIPGANFPNPSESFAEMVEMLIAENLAHQAVFILDTTKKFTDVMDKKASTRFMSTCRRLTEARGTIIALAHVNKNKNHENKSIPAGTSDVLDDCDCGYVIDLLSEEKVLGGVKRTVEFRHLKGRGPTVQSAVYSYVQYADGDYERMFYSVKLVDGDEADRAREQKALQVERLRDAALIAEIQKLLTASGGAIQKDIVTQLVANDAYSHRTVRSCLQRWSCPAEEGGIWTVTKGENNSSIYKLIPPN